MFAAKLQRSLRQKHLDPAVGPKIDKFPRIRLRELREHFAAMFVIDGTPIVRIDQRKLQNLVALINVGHAGGSQFKQRLRKRVDRAESRDLFGHGKKTGEKFTFERRFQNLRDKITHRREPFFIWLNPARIDVRFIQRFRHVGLNALDVLRRRVLFRFARRLDWPGPN